MAHTLKLTRRQITKLAVEYANEKQEAEYKRLREVRFNAQKKLGEARMEALLGSSQLKKLRQLETDVRALILKATKDPSVAEKFEVKASGNADYFSMSASFHHYFRCNEHYSNIKSTVRLRKLEADLKAAKEAEENAQKNAARIDETSLLKAQAADDPDVTKAIETLANKMIAFQTKAAADV